MKMKKLYLVTIVLMTIILPTTLIAAGGKGPVKSKTIAIGMSNPNLGEPWLVQMNTDVRTEAAKHTNVKVLFKDAQNDVLKQRSHVEEFITAGVDAILISPIEGTPLTASIARAMDAGIPVFVLDRKIDGNKYTQFIGTDNVALGYALGKWVVKHYAGKKANVVQLDGLMTSTPGAERHEGFLKAIKGTDVKVIFTADAKWLEPNGRAEMESVLARFDKIDVVFGGNDPTAHGAYLAAKAAGREGGIAFLGIDGLVQEGRVYVKEGILNATIYAPTGGDIALRNALKVLKGEKVKKDLLIDCVLFEENNLNAGGETLSFPELKKK
jgi:ribose transport system substrate-binding protein